MNLNDSTAKRITLRVLLLIAMLGAVLGLTPRAQPVSAQDAGITLKAEAAYGGNFKYGEWLPVYVTIENQGGDLDVEARIQVSSSQGSIVFATPVGLPSGSRKLVTVYVLPNNFSRELEVQLISKGKAVQSKKFTVSPHPNITYMVGLLASERGALSILNGISFPGQNRPVVLVDLQLSELPARAEALRSFDLLVVNDFNTSKLSAEQSAAIAGWVVQGGHLVIGGGGSAQRTVSGLPAELLPAPIEGSREINTDGLQPLASFAGSEPIKTAGPFVAARAVSPDSHILAGESSLPFVQEKSYGSGSIHFVAFDLAGVPFNGWPGTQAFWEALTGPGRAFPENMPFDVPARQMRASQLSYALSNIPSLDLPSIQGLSILLVIYIIIVGPVNYLVLRWRRKLHWAWFTIPVITVLFTAGAFGIGYAMRGNDLILNKIALVEVKPDGSAAVTSYMGLFSPRMQSYEVSISGDSLISPMSYDVGPWGPNGAPVTGGEMVFYQGLGDSAASSSRVRGLTVNQFAMQSFMSEDVWSGFGKISGDLRIQNDNLVGKVRNDSKYTLTDAIIIFQSRFARLGDMAPGSEKDVDLALASLQGDRFGPPLSYRIFQERFPNQQMPRADEIKSNIVSTLFENGPWAKVQSTLGPGASGSGPFAGITLIGWIDQAPPNVNVQDNRLTQKTTGLVYAPLNYQLPESGYLTLPTGLVPGALVKNPVDSGSCGTTTSIHMGKGQAEFDFQAPDSLGKLQVTTLKLAVWSDNGNPAGLPAIKLYNWGSKDWTIIQDPIMGTNVIQNAGPYVDEKGAVRIQLDSKSDTFGCIYLDLGLEAERLAGKGG